MHVGPGSRVASPSVLAREDAIDSHPSDGDRPHPGVGSDRRSATSGGASFADLLLEVEDGTARSAAGADVPSDGGASSIGSAGRGTDHDAHHDARDDLASDRDPDRVGDIRDPAGADRRAGSRAADRAPAVVTRVARALVAPARSPGLTRVRVDLTAAGLPGREVTLTHTASGVAIAFSGGMTTGAGADLARSLPDLLHHLRHAGVDVADVSVEGRSASADPDGRGDHPGPEDDAPGEEPPAA